MSDCAIVGGHVAQSDDPILRCHVNHRQSNLVGNIDIAAQQLPSKG